MSLNSASASKIQTQWLGLAVGHPTLAILPSNCTINDLRRSNVLGAQEHA